MAIAETLKLYREGVRNQLTSDSGIDGVLRELTMDVHGGEVIEWCNLPDEGSNAYLVKLTDYPALVKRTNQATHALVEIDGGNFLSWWSFATEEDARAAYDEHTEGWDPDDEDPTPPMFEVVGSFVYDERSDELIPVDGTSSSEFIREQMLLRQANETAEREYEQRDPE